MVFQYLEIYKFTLNACECYDLYCFLLIYDNLESLMIITIDSHLHSNNSHDGKSTIYEMCLVAIEKGLTSICFTEHLEQNPGDRGYGFFNHKKYSDDINRAREKCCGKINILQGIEFSEPHEHPAEFERILKLNFDFVLGSVHNLGDYWAGDRYFQKMHSTKEIWEIHYTEILLYLKFLRGKLLHESLFLGYKILLQQLLVQQSLLFYFQVFRQYNVYQE